LELILGVIKMAITVEARTSIIELVVGMFGAAPGASVLSDLVASYEAGTSIKQMAASLANTNEFKSIYPSFLTTDEFSVKLVDQLLAEASTEAKAEAVVVLTAALNGGMTRSDAYVEAINFVNSTESDNETFGTSATAFDNKVAVAIYYSVDKQLSGSSLAELQSIVSGVTSDEATVTAANAVSNGTASVGKSFTLTTTQDTLAGTGGDDTFNGIYGGATGDTVTAGDTIDGGNGNDTLKITAQGANASPAAFGVKNVENIVINDLVGATFNALSVESAPTIAFSNTVSGNTSTVTNASLASEFSLNGAGNLTVNYATAAGTALLDLNTVTGSTIDVANGNALTAATIDTTGKNSFTLNAGSAAATISLTGDGTNTLTVGSISATSTIDASASTGTNTLNLGAGLSNGDVVKGGRRCH
jgi:hypothetical protein